jgi:hypothetical protein
MGKSQAEREETILHRPLSGSEGYRPGRTEPHDLANRAQPPVQSNGRHNRRSFPHGDRSG